MENTSFIQDSFILLNQHLEALRNMVVIWDDAEVGAPFVDLYTFPYNYNNIGKAIGVLLDEDDINRQTKLFEEFKFIVENIFTIFCQNATLEEGSYTYKNPFKSLDLKDWSLESVNDRYWFIPKEDEITIKVTK